jgi:pilus assembly protein CpaB
MSKSSKALIQIGLALTLAIVAGVVIFRWASNMRQAAPVAATQTRTVSVVVTREPARRGMKLTGEMLDVRMYTADSQPVGSYAKSEELVGRVLNQDMGANEAVTALKLADEAVMGGGVSAMIEPGKRAMAVKGNMVMGLSGFVHPGDRVDVLVSLTEGREEKPVTKMVLEWVKVLATGTQLDTPTEEGVTASVDVYTLELSPQESERLALASTRGTLHFALRNLVDNATVLTHGETPKSALAAFRPKPKPKKRVRGKKQVSVQVISGADATKVKF